MTENTLRTITVPNNCNTPDATWVVTTFSPSHYFTLLIGYYSTEENKIKIVYLYDTPMQVLL